MKSSNNISKVFLLISIYCFGICAVAATPLSNFVDSFEVYQDHPEILDNASQLHFVHTQQPETIFSATVDYNLPETKLIFKDFATAITSFDIEIQSRYKQYVNTLKTVDIRYRKSDIIFPFHNFW
tara:strand:- start:910 stop:1284 length:375 start_codon:yes stop_codon:yes gene_type:complete